MRQSLFRSLWIAATALLVGVLVICIGPAAKAQRGDKALLEAHTRHVEKVQAVQVKFDELLTLINKQQLERQRLLHGIHHELQSQWQSDKELFAAGAERHHLMLDVLERRNVELIVELKKIHSEMISDLNKRHHLSLAEQPGK